MQCVQYVLDPVLEEKNIIRSNEKIGIRIVKYYTDIKFPQIDRCTVYVPLKYIL